MPSTPPAPITTPTALPSRSRSTSPILPIPWWSSPITGVPTIFDSRMEVAGISDRNCCESWGMPIRSGGCCGAWASAGPAAAIIADRAKPERDLAIVVLLAHLRAVARSNDRDAAEVARARRGAGSSLDRERRRIPGHRGVFRRHRLERFAHDRSDCGVARPFAVGRDHVPGRPGRRAAGEHDLIGLLELVPELAVFEVGRVELPAALGLVETVLQPFGLLLLGYVEHELEDSGAVQGQHLLEGIDLFVARLDLVGRREAAHPRDEHVFVMRAVEDADHAAA